MRFSIGKNRSFGKSRPRAQRLLFERGMKYFLVLLIAGSTYTFFFRSSPVAPAAKATTAPRIAVSAGPASSQAQSAPAPSNILKRPLDRTHQVLDQVRKQRDETAL
jgi:hypothetical protein